MQFKKALPGLVVLVAACATGAALADDVHFSSVTFVAGNGTAAADVDGTAGIVAEVGKPAEFHIKYQIGWFIPPEAGTVGALTPKSSDVEDPQYAFFWDNTIHNDPQYPPGMVFDGDTGVFSGTPTQAGSWSYFPGVRDKEHGESPYRGDGFWNTDFNTWQDKTWIESKYPGTFVVLVPPSPKAVKLSCSSGSVSLLIQVDYDSGIVRVFGNDGNLAGVYHANISDDFIAWGKTNISKPALYVTSFKIDRGSGDFSTTADNGTPPSGSCQKRSTEHKF